MNSGQQLKNRIQREDDLVNARINIFLVLNGLGAVAVSLSVSPGSKYLISLVGVAVNVLWIILSIQCLIIIFRLTKKLIDLGIEEDLAEQIVQSALSKTIMFRPNAILLIYIPFIILSAWVVGFWNLN